MKPGIPLNAQKPTVPTQCLGDLRATLPSWSIMFIIIFIIYSIRDKKIEIKLLMYFILGLQNLN